MNTTLNPHPKGPAAARKAQGYDTDHDRLAEAERNLREVKRVLSFVPGDVWIKAIEDAKAANGPMKVSEEMVSRFLRWPLPKSVRPDSCVMVRDYPDRIGTNLLTADEARQMLTYVLLNEASK
jgi:hypothetical protein